MKAVRYHEYGTDQVLRIEDTETPTPGHEEVLVKVVATSFNPIDAAMRAGYLQSAFAVDLPHTPGIDVGRHRRPEQIGRDRHRGGRRRGRVSASQRRRRHRRVRAGTREPADGGAYLQRANADRVCVLKDL